MDFPLRRPKKYQQIEVDWHTIFPQFDFFPAKIMDLTCDTNFTKGDLTTNMSMSIGSCMGIELWLVMPFGKYMFLQKTITLVLVNTICGGDFDNQHDPKWRFNADEYLVGGFNPSEKIWVRQLGWWFPIYGNVPNHQPVVNKYLTNQHRGI